MSRPLPPPPDDLLQGAALFLDFDGTLIDLAPTPDGICVPPELPGALLALRDRLGGRLAVVSGRALCDLRAYLPLDTLTLAGSHGLELFVQGEAVPLSVPHEALAEAVARAEAFAAERDGVLVERKPLGVGLHYRLAPSCEHEVVALAEALARDTGLILQRGKMVAELRPGGADKGDAVRAIMAEPPFIGARPMFVGDDLTDEHGFAAAAALGGAGVLVGAPRNTAAVYGLPDPAAVRAWLGAA